MYGPVPTGCCPYESPEALTAFSLSIAVVGWHKWLNKAPNGCLVITLTVFSSTTSTLSTVPIMWDTCGELFILSKENLTSAAVKGSPLWNFTPFLKWNTVVTSSGCSHDSARLGIIFIFSSCSTNLSYIWTVTFDDGASFVACGSKDFASAPLATTKVSFVAAFAPVVSLLPPQEINKNTDRSAKINRCNFFFINNIPP